MIHGIQGLPEKLNKGFISNSGIVVSDEGVVIIHSDGSLQRNSSNDKRAAQRRLQVPYL